MNIYRKLTDNSVPKVSEGAAQTGKKPASIDKPNKARVGVDVDVVEAAAAQTRTDSGTPVQQQPQQPRLGERRGESGQPTQASPAEDAVTMHAAMPASSVPDPQNGLAGTQTPAARNAFAVQERPEQGHMDAVRHRVMTCCNEKNPQLTKSKRDAYDLMREEVRQLMSSSALSFDELQSIIAPDDKHKSNLANTALARGNLHAAVAVLGILESDARLNHMASLVEPCIKRLLEALDEQTGENKAWAQDAISRINVGREPCKHVRQLFDSLAVTLPGTPESQQVKNCTEMHLLFLKSQPAGFIQCTASGRIPELEHDRYRPADTEDGRRAYMISHTELQPAGPYAPVNEVRPEQAYIKATRDMARMCCSEKAPQMNTAKQSTYDAMSQRIGQLMGFRCLTADDKFKIISYRGGLGGINRVAEEAVSRGNLHAALAVYFGILESDASLSTKRFLLFEDEGMHLLDALDKVPPKDKSWAEVMKVRFNNVYDPVVRFENIGSVETVALRGAVRSCTAMNLRFVENPRGDVMVCQATGLIPELSHNKYYPRQVPNGYKYAIPLSELQLRSRD